MYKKIVSNVELIDIEAQNIDSADQERLIQLFFELIHKSALANLRAAKWQLSEINLSAEYLHLADFEVSLFCRLRQSSDYLFGEADLEDERLYESWEASFTHNNQQLVLMGELTDTFSPESTAFHKRMVVDVRATEQFYPYEKHIGSHFQQFCQLLLDEVRDQGFRPDNDQSPIDVDLNQILHSLRQDGITGQGSQSRPRLYHFKQRHQRLQLLCTQLTSY